MDWLVAAVVAVAAVSDPFAVVFAPTLQQENDASLVEDTDCTSALVEAAVFFARTISITLNIPRCHGQRALFSLLFRRISNSVVKILCTASLLKFLRLIPVLLYHNIKLNKNLTLLHPIPIILYFYKVSRVVSDASCPRLADGWLCRKPSQTFKIFY